MPVRIDDGRGNAVTLALVYEQPGASIPVSDGSVTINALPPIPFISVVSGGVQPGIEPLTDGDNITAGIPTGADALGNYETRAAGESIALVVVTATVNGVSVGEIARTAA